MAAHGFSQRHACRLIEVDPKTVRRASVTDARTRPAKAALRER
jgi:hypothetical protein